jgi:hypothetical protein
VLHGALFRDRPRVRRAHAHGPPPLHRDCLVLASTASTASATSTTATTNKSDARDREREVLDPHVKRHYVHFFLFIFLFSLGPRGLKKYTAQRKKKRNPKKKKRSWPPEKRKKGKKKKEKGKKKRKRKEEKGKKKKEK